MSARVLRLGTLQLPQVTRDRLRQLLRGHSARELRGAAADLAAASRILTHSQNHAPNVAAARDLRARRRRDEEAAEAEAEARKELGGVVAGARAQQRLLQAQLDAARGEEEEADEDEADGVDVDDDEEFYGEDGDLDADDPLSSASSADDGVPSSASASSSVVSVAEPHGLPKRAPVLGGAVGGAAAGGATVAWQQALSYDRRQTMGYVASRLPGAYAAAVRALSEVRARVPALDARSPRTMLDFGAGPGTAVLAALDTWADVTGREVDDEDYEDVNERHNEEEEEEEEDDPDVAKLRELDPELADFARYGKRQIDARAEHRRRLSGRRVHGTAVSSAASGRGGGGGGGGGLEEVLAVEPSSSMQEAGAALLRDDVPSLQWKRFLFAAAPQGVSYDLVTAFYSLGELETRSERQMVLDTLWKATSPGGVLVILEPGTPVGFNTVIAARTQLLSKRSTVAGPCPHAYACPVGKQQKAWCHFSQKVQRFPLTPGASAGKAGFEDEKFSWVAFRKPHLAHHNLRDDGVQAFGGEAAGDDVFEDEFGDGYQYEPLPSLADDEEMEPDAVAAERSQHADAASVTKPFSKLVWPPMKRGGHVVMDTCDPDGECNRRVVTRRHGKNVYKAARKLRWGDEIDYDGLERQPSATPRLT